MKLAQPSLFDYLPHLPHRTCPPGQTLIGRRCVRTHSRPHGQWLFCKVDCEYSVFFLDIVLRRHDTEMNVSRGNRLIWSHKCQLLEQSTKSGSLEAIRYSIRRSWSSQDDVETVCKYSSDSGHCKAFNNKDNVFIDHYLREHRDPSQIRGNISNCNKGREISLTCKMSFLSRKKKRFCSKHIWRQNISAHYLLLEIIVADNTLSYVAEPYYKREVLPFTEYMALLC